ARGMSSRISRAMPPAATSPTEKRTSIHDFIDVNDTSYGAWEKTTVTYVERRTITGLPIDLRWRISDRTAGACSNACVAVGRGSTFPTLTSSISRSRIARAAPRVARTCPPQSTQTIDERFNNGRLSGILG